MCHLSVLKRKEICSGVKCDVPVTTGHPAPLVEGTTLPTPLATQNQTKCVKGWTRWCDKDRDTSDKSVRLNDEEKVPRYDRMENVYGTCLKQYMTKVECRVKDTHEAPEQMDENVVCSLEEVFGVLENATIMNCAPFASAMRN